MVSGRTFDIRHPETLRVGRRDLVIFSLVSDDPQVHDKWDTIGTMLVESVSHLEQSGNPTPNK
jgi:hypothetical protein